MFATTSDDYFVAKGAPAHSHLILWNTKSMRAIARHPLLGSAALQDGAVFSPDGRFIAATTNGNTPDTEIWDIASGQLVASPEEGTGRRQREVMSLTFSPDGTTLALAMDTGTVRFLSTSTWADSRPSILGVGENASIEYSPDGSLLAVASGGRVSLWDVQTGRRLGSAFIGSQDNQTGIIKFLPDGRSLLLTTFEPAVIFKTDIASWRAQACAVIGGVTEEQWQTIAPDESYRSTCG
jgi:WD40 repeat protein